MSSDNEMLESQEETIQSYEFTTHAQNKMDDILEVMAHVEHGADFLYQKLLSELPPAFGDYLKRYVFERYGLSVRYDDYREVDLSIYSDIIVNAFNANLAKHSFSETATKLSQFVRGCLTQASVTRDTVFLLGFGLAMDVADVSAFLLKALKERDFNFKDPHEVLYWYCFKEALPFCSMEKLKKAFDAKPAVKDSSAFYEQTVHIRSMFENVSGSEELLRSLSQFKSTNRADSRSATAYEHFMELYDECSKIVSSLEHDGIANNTRIERTLYGSMLINTSGNLPKTEEFTLSAHFGKTRLSRHRLGRIISKKDQVDRFDLITMNFFIYAHDERYEFNDRDKQNERIRRNRHRSAAFIESTNEILNRCSMWELYVANPYELFLMICISDSKPFKTFSDVWDKSYRDDI